MRPHRQQPTRLHRAWDSSGKNTGVGCHFLLQCISLYVLGPNVPNLLPIPEPLARGWVSVIGLVSCQLFGMKWMVGSWPQALLQIPFLGTDLILTFWLIRLDSSVWMKDMPLWKWHWVSQYFLLRDLISAFKWKYPVEMVDALTKILCVLFCLLDWLLSLKVILKC